MKRELLLSPGAVRLDQRLKERNLEIFGNPNRGTPLTLIDQEYPKRWETVDSIAVKQLIEVGKLVRNDAFYEASDQQ